MGKVSKKGFTIVELIFVLCILAIIFAIIIPLFPTIAQNMKVRADKASAGNIANAIKVWYIDYSTDDKLKDSVEFIANKEMLTKEVRKSIAISELVGVDSYVSSLSTKSTSLLDENKVTVRDQSFFVSLIEEGINVKVVITVGTEGVQVSDDSVVDYDGSKNGIIYIGK